MFAGSLLVQAGLLVLGILALYIGAEMLVKGASALALGFGLQAATVGVTVIAFATTAPELFVAVIGAVTVSTDIGLGAILGSNIANIGLVLGISAMIRPIDVSRTVLRYHVPFMFVAVLLLVGLGWNGQIGRPGGVILLATLVVFTIVIIRQIQTQQAAQSQEDRAEAPDSGLTEIALVIGGLVTLVVGSRWLIDGGRGLLAAAGIPDLVIGLTVLAIGTSLPELAASAVSALRDEASFSIGNVVGSNIYNILAVIGILTLIEPISVAPGVRRFEFPVLVVFTVGVIAIMWRKRHVSRVEGGILAIGYAVFIYSLTL